MRPSLVAVAAVIVVWSLVAGEGAKERPAADIDGLAWLAGTWTGGEGAVETEEVWLPPKGGAMLGVHRDVRGDRMVSFEFLRIANRQGKLTYFASPGGARPTPFPLKDLDGRRVVFENLEHDYPQRILYWIAEDGSLHARVEGDKDGAKGPMEWVWRKPADPASRPK